ncbi:MAG: hypothetical protein EP338_07900 [Bacteroidetes bacterium]|nr:MAG: hypothetical protein EP338_07900 [Bacteroidota bacterium]
MSLAHPKQRFQDWLTQQWVIIRGRRIDSIEHAWLIGPFGNLEGIGEGFIHELAQQEGLIVDRDPSSGLLSSIDQLNLAEDQLSSEVIRFYERTAEYDLQFRIKWNPFFRVFGVLLNRLFSRRLNQLNIPTRNIRNGEELRSEIITLKDAQSNEVKHTIWFRAFRSTGQVVYSGVYGTCKLPSGQTCIKAVFPLPMGNATVIMIPNIGPDGELILNSSGRKFGDAGFYFLIQDVKGRYWSRFVRSFKDELSVCKSKDQLSAKQKLSVWGWRVLTFQYDIRRRKE